MIYGNLPPTNQGTNTTNYFENLFSSGASVSSNVNDAIIGFFQTVTGNADTGTALAASVLYTALNQSIDPMELLDNFRAMDKQELNAYLTMFLNFNRKGTSLLGLSNSPQANKYITRAILP